jgi:CRISPR-associated protein Cmr4
LKGATKGFLSDWGDDTRIAAFGAGGTDGNQGCMLWPDFRLLFLPARSLAGTFAWTTSMLALARFERFLRLVVDESHGALAALQGLLKTARPATGEAVAPQASSIVQLAEDGKAIVEGFVLDASGDADGNLQHFLGWLTQTLFPGEDYWPDFFAQRALIMAENDFAHLCRESLPVEGNIQINPETGVTTDGSLRYTEFLPAESLMYSPLSILPPLSKVGDQDVHLEVLTEWQSWIEKRPVIQFGADESKGKGVSQLSYVNDEDSFPARATASSPKASTDEGSAS